eukprot:jgi/Pico_ML_1/51980/g2763.t1
MEVSKKAMVMVLVLSSGALAAHGVLVLHLLISLLDRHPQVTILDINGSTLASGLATVVLSCLALGIVMTTFYLMKLNSALLGVDESSQAEPDTLSTEQLEKLPIVVYDTVLVEEGLEKASSDSPRVGGMSREGCPICIEEYEDGEKHKTCPVCKYNANEKKVKTHYSETVPLVVQHPELRQSYTDLTTLNAAESLLATSPHHPATPSRRMDEAIPGDALV